MLDLPRSLLVAFHAQILSKGATVAQGRETLAEATSRSSFEVTFDVDLARRASPSSRIVILYTTESNELVADSVEFNVDALFQNQVSCAY